MARLKAEFDSTDIQLEGGPRTPVKPRGQKKKNEPRKGTATAIEELLVMPTRANHGLQPLIALPPLPARQT